MSKIEQHKEKLKLVPKKPGVYIMKNVDGRVIYVGKAKALYNRLAQYFIGTPKDQKTMQMVMHVDEFDYIITNSEKDALILENNLIKKYKPKYNILLKDDKTYPFIQINLKETYPYLSLVRETKKNSNKYYGPFLNAFLVNEIIDIVSKEFKLRSCKIDLAKGKKRECLNYHIGFCSAPCTRKVEIEEYRKNLDSAIAALDGGLKNILPSLKDKMQKFSENLDFENAAKMRDKIKIIEKFSEKHQVITVKKINLDVIYIYREADIVGVALLEVKNGIINDKKSYTFLETANISNDEIVSSFIEQYYLVKDLISSRVIVNISENFEIDYNSLSESLSNVSGKNIIVSKGRGRFSRNLTKMAEVNAIEAIKLRLETKIDDQLFKLKEKLNLYKTPMRIESYDNSNTAGSNPVGVMTVFENGVLSQKEKRTFGLKGLNGSDDYQNMYEVIDRRLRNLNEGTKGFENAPDLIFVDGGKGQVKIAKKALSNYDFDIPIFGLVKDDKHRLKDITNGYADFNVKEDRQLWTFIGKINEETHKNAITYHKKKNTLTATQSELLEISGVGKSTMQKLYKEFKTIKNIKVATVEELSKVVPNTTANNIFNAYHQNNNGILTIIK